MADYYVSTTGSDSAAGSEGAPFLTLQKAHDVAVAGDTIYMRGGTYSVNQVTITRDGSSGNPIRVFNYTGEVPILDGSSAPEVYHVVVYMDNASWWHWMGITIRNSAGNGMQLTNTCSNNIIERCIFHDNGRIGSIGNGLSVYGASANNLILNCDAHHNRDPVGGNSDGIQVFTTGSGNVVRGNRCWRNSDDGIDFWNSTGVLAENNWSWENGLDDALEPTGGNGEGFKLGGTGSGDGSHIIRNNLSWRNRNSGFKPNLADLPMTLYNNTAWDNQNYNYNFADNIAHILRNNISFAGPGVNIHATCDETFNSWNLGVTVSSADFASLDFSTAATTARNADGSLPTLSFLHLVSGSDLIDAGTNVGIAYSGSAPDLGAYEFAAATTTISVSPTTVAPSATVTVTWANVASPTTTDWFLIRPPGNEDYGGLYTNEWQYTSSCTQTPGGTPLAAGSCSFTIPSDVPTGTYEMRLLYNDGFTVLATSDPFTVAPAGTVKIVPIIMRQYRERRR